MWFRSLLPSWKLLASRSQRLSQPRPVRRSPRLVVEYLEDRSLPSSYSAATVSALIADITAANRAGGANTITLTAAMTSPYVLTAVNNTTNGATGLPVIAASDNLTIIGNGDTIERSTATGTPAFRLLEVAGGGSLTLDSLTIENGQTVGDFGGGILNETGGTVTLDHAILTGNQSLADNQGNDGGSGGGIENEGTLSVANSSFGSNLAALNSTSYGSNGGAIDDSTGPLLTVTNCAFYDNQADGTSEGDGSGEGGAINNSGSTAVITGSTFDGNAAHGRLTDGGAINHNGGSMAISNCTFTTNEAVGGNGANDYLYADGGEALGGAVLNAAPLTITGSTFTDNLAKGGEHGDNSSNAIDGGGFVGIATGGGVCNFFSTLSVSNSTFTDNEAVGGNSAIGPGGDAAGGGILGAGFASSSLTDVMFVGNQSVGGSGAAGNPGGSGLGGGFYSGVYSTATVTHASFRGNLAQGGLGGQGAAGGNGQGGAIANGGGFGQLVVAAIGAGPDNSSLSLESSSLVLNVAQGGAGAPATVGGSGLGGGAYILGGTTASIDTTFIATNAALGGSPGKGGTIGQGGGGGLYLDNGSVVTLGNPTEVFLNFASTSDDDIFGIYTG